MGKTYTYTPALLEQLRRNAQRLKRDLGIPLNEAQNRIAAEHGFRNWSLLSKQCLAATPASASTLVTPTSTGTSLAPALRRFRELLQQDLSSAEARHEPTLLTHQTLPVSLLTANEVVEQGMVKMSVAELDRATKNNRFYSVALVGGRAFPAWQFIDPVPEMLADVIKALREYSAEIHAFAVTAQDGLNELAPAEVLAGIPFDGRAALEPSQMRILKLPAATRKDRVLVLAWAYPDHG